MNEIAGVRLNVAVVGLGSMGKGIAASAVRGGHRVWGIDVNPALAASFRAEGGQAGELAKVSGDLDIVAVVVVNAGQTESVLFGKQGVVAGMRPGSLVLACATVPPAFAKEMAARCAEAGVLYLDAPISGGSARAAAGRLSIMASGPDEAFSMARPLLSSIADTVFELGHEPGAGSAMKAVNQLLAGVHIATMAEALTFGMMQGISPEKFLEVISNCAGTSWMLENRAPHIAAGDYEPHSALNIWPKDLGIVLDIANSSSFSAPITAVALQQFVAATEMGLGLEDDAAVAKVYARNAGLTLPGEV